jgi:hypothetical protein
MYNIAIVKASDGSYLVNHYRKSADTRLPDFAAVMLQLMHYAKRPEFFETDITMIDLSTNEIKAVQKLRELVLEERL